MPTNYNGYTVPAPTDIADAPAAFEEFSDSIPFSEYVAVESLSAHTTVVDSYNGKMIFATADLTLTFGTLTDGFSVAITADTGVTVDYLGVDKASQESTAYQIATVVAVNGTNIISIAGGGLNPPGSGKVIEANSSNAALRITQTGTGDVLLVEDQAGDSTPFVVNASGSLLLGTNTSSAVYAAGKLQIVGTTTAHGHIARFTANSSAPSFTLGKSRGTSPTSLGIVSSQDEVGRLGFYADDGTQFLPTALIASYVDGTPGLNDMPGRLSFQTGVDGGPGVAERMRINNAGLITGTGTSLGSWTEYTPTLSGTGWEIGNGTVTGSYCQIGKIVNFTALVTFGSTSTFGSAPYSQPSPSLTVPVTASTGAIYLSNSECEDVSAGTYYATMAHRVSTTTIEVRALNSSQQYAFIDSTFPFTWAAGDIMRVQGTYEAA